MLQSKQRLSKNRQGLRVVAFITVIVLMIGTGFYHFFESMSWLDAFYLSVITLTTVGYGDIAPQTDAGKLFTVVYVIVGIGIIATFARLLFENTFVRRLSKNK